MGAYGQAVRRSRQREKREDAMGKGEFYPPGFDIRLDEVINEYELDEKQIRKLGELIATRTIANAFVGKAVYYRRATIERLFGNAKQAEVQQ